MPTVKIGTKNQIVIPKEIRKKIPGLVAGRNVTVYALNDGTVAIKASSKNWAEESSGAMKKAWKNIDPIKELEKMRNEW